MILEDLKKVPKAIELIGKWLNKGTLRNYITCRKSNVLDGCEKESPVIELHYIDDGNDVTICPEEDFFIVFSKYPNEGGYLCDSIDKETKNILYQYLAPECVDRYQVILNLAEAITLGKLGNTIEDIKFENF